MAVGSADIKWYKSNNASTGAASALTGKKGGGINTGSQLTGVLHELFPPVTGTDTASSNFTDFRKIYVSNTSSDALNNVRAWLQPSAYTQDSIFISLGLTDTSYLVAGASSVGAEDYDEHTTKGSYPRVSGDSTDIASVDTYSFDYTKIGPTATYVRLTLPSAIVTSYNTYVRIIGEYSGSIVVGYIYVPTKASGAPTTIIAQDNPAGGGANVTFSRVYCASIHKASNGDLDVFKTDTGLGTADCTFESDDNSGFATPLTCGKIKSNEAVADCQVFVPGWIPEGNINTSLLSAFLPTLHYSVTPPDNEYDLKTVRYQSFWIKRVVLQNATPSPGITNTIHIYGDSA